jgi:hypothetical protein
MALLAKEANCTKRSVINALKKIPKDELQIVARGQGKGNSNRYRLLLPLESEKVKSTTEKVKSDSPEPEGTIIKETPIVPKGDEPKALKSVRIFFNIPLGQPWDTKTLEAYHRNRECIESTGEDEWRLLYRLYQATGGDAFKYRRKSPVALLRNWTAEITRAQSWLGPQPRPNREIPENWRQILLAADPLFNCPPTWAELPESLQSYVRGNA